MERCFEHTAVSAGTKKRYPAVGSLYRVLQAGLRMMKQCTDEQGILSLARNLLRALRAKPFKGADARSLADEVM